MFRNADNIVITGGQFISVDRYHGGTQDAVSTTLWPHVAHRAIFNSAQRYSAGKCHPGTRQEVIKTISNWIEDPDLTNPILWLYGPAGSGKSALAHTICELLDKSESHQTALYSGSFFFSKGPIDCDNAIKLFTTLSYQLAVQFPAIRIEINKALSHDPSLPTKSMEVQLLSLIVQPLLQCQTLLSRCLVLIIDGLDECAEDEEMNTQRNIVTLITKSVVDYNLPLRFMIASRPEYWIRDAFDTAPFISTTLRLPLQDDYDARADIEKCLIDGFEKIRAENTRVMTSVVPPWPAPNIIEHFVFESSGQFVYASTVLKFVGKFSRFSNPQEQLRIITSPGPSRALAFSELDRLYVTILSSYPRWKNMKRVLEGILMHCNTTIINVVLGVDRDEMALVLEALSSLVNQQEPFPLKEDELLLQSTFGSLLDGRHEFSLYHRSLGEFLADETRSGSFHIEFEEMQNKILGYFFEMIHRNLDQNYEIQPHIFLNLDIATYYKVMCKVTVTSPYISCYTIESMLPHIIHMTQRLLRPGSRGWMNFLPCFMYDMGCLEYLLRHLDIHGGEHGFNIDGGEPQTLEQFRIACDTLQDAISQAKRDAIRALPLCSEFKVTPTLVYLTEYHEGVLVSLHKLSTIPGTTDVDSTIQQHRHFIKLSLGNMRWMPWRVDLRGLLDGRTDIPSRIRHEWQDQQIWLAHQLLQSIFSGDYLPPSCRYYDENPIYDTDNDDKCKILAKHYFGAREISDICTEEHFQCQHNLLILDLITDLSAWSRQRDTRQVLPKEFITSILCWFNRQLTNSKTLTLLEDHDNGLERKMTIAMNTIFEQRFLPQFMESYEKQLCVIGLKWKDLAYISITLAVLPLPQGIHQEEQSLSPRTTGEDTVLVDSDHWRLFHDEIFGKPSSGGIKNTQITIIDPSRWDPYLASGLLKALARHLCYETTLHHPDVLTRLKVTELLPYIMQSLPYAQPTSENLDALRAIVYLYPQLPIPLSFPVGFWLLIMGVLRRYDRSVLSFEEQELFEAWLRSTDHSDIKNYVLQH